MFAYIPRRKFDVEMPRWPEGDRGTISNFIANRLDAGAAIVADDLACGCDSQRGQPVYRQAFDAIGTIGPAPNSSPVNLSGTTVSGVRQLRTTGFS